MSMGPQGRYKLVTGKRKRLAAYGYIMHQKVSSDRLHDPGNFNGGGMSIEVEVSKFVITIGKKKIQLSTEEAIDLHNILGERLYNLPNIKKIIKETKEKK